MDHMVIGGRPGSLGESIDFEKQDANLSLRDRLKPFKSSQFDPDDFINSKCHNLTEKYSKGNTSFGGATAITKKPVISSCSSDSWVSRWSSCKFIITGPTRPISNHKNKELTKIETWLEEFLEILVAERRVEEALVALDPGDKVVKDAHDKRTLNATTLISLHNAITKSRQKLADQLVKTARKSSTKGAELRSVVLALKRLGDGPRAHTLLLKAHHQKLQLSMQNMKPATKSNGGAYCGSLSKLVFSTIAQASNDSLAVFGEDTSYTSELLTWAVKETEQVGLILRRQYRNTLPLQLLLGISEPLLNVFKFV